MARLFRGAIVALIAVLVGLGGALPSQAAVAPSPSPATCSDIVDGYPVPRECTLNIQVLSPICDNEVPKLRYKVIPEGTTKDTVTITWINPSGANVVYADLPLEGTVNWPGAVEDSTGRGIDWPGWRQLADGSWVEGDEFDWVRPSVVVNFKVNPEDTVTVAYPPSSPSCNTNPPGNETLASNPTSAVLSATGSEAGPLAAIGAGLVVIGALAVALVAIARRRRTVS
ncbi:peptidase [Cellulomonas sp. P5_C5]